ncbi:MAG: TetR/AcrR family transcriptional regulator [Rhodospirillaceae bacterium]|nr:TetR/AcrR family transcriptional regulator [Rhodospirillaceae bacterium]
MPLSKTHKQNTRDKILDAAGLLFRRHGFDGVGIDKIMAQAGLTRGGFYAHFDSKADLFNAVLEQEPALKRMLNERQSESKDESLQGTLDVLATYLDPGNTDYVTSSCPMVSLARDVDKGGPAARDALTKVITDLTALFKRGMSEGGQIKRDERALSVLALCVGGVTIARTANNPALAQQILNACEHEAERLLKE